MSAALLIDIGNSRMKWALASPGKPLYGHGAFAYESLDAADRLATLAAQLPSASVTAAVIVSVGRRDLAQGLRDRLQGGGITQVLSAKVQREFAGLTVGYTHIANLGVDRWVALLGAHRVAGYPCTVIDCGTALTIDAVDGQGQHLGGAIAPGRTLQRRSLRQSTARIRSGQGEPAPELLFARDTGVAVAAGVDHGLAALVTHAHERVGDLLAGERPEGAPSDWPALLVTGGDAPDLLPLLPAHTQHVDDLVLEGARSLLEGAEEIR